MKRISVFGSTGSIGTNTLDVVARNHETFEIRYLTTYRNVPLLFEQAEKFKPQAVAIIDESKVGSFNSRFKELGIEVLTGFEGLLEISKKEDVDIVVNALVGAVGLKPTMNAIQKGRRVALANKETLVIGGHLVMAKAKACGAEVIPIDSEHSAILQCIVGERDSDIRRIVLTASGGPFRNKKKEEFKDITVAEALNHPNWSMGNKITIDSATLMNKGLEVIEAFWLFNLKPEEIDVVVHPQSIIHSFVEFNDGSLKAQLGLPDMRIPIQYALTFPVRMPGDFPRLNFNELHKLTFEQPDVEKFRSLKLAFDVLREGGSAPVILNAANEEAVDLFLNKKINFAQIPVIVEDALANCNLKNYDSVEDLMSCDKTAREFVLSKY